MNFLHIFLLPLQDIGTVLIASSAIIGSLGTIIGGVGGILATYLRIHRKKEEAVKEITVTIDDGTTQSVIVASSTDDLEQLLQNLKSKIDIKNAS